MVKSETGKRVRKQTKNETGDSCRLARMSRDGDAFVRAIISSLAANIAVIDRQGRIIYVNEAWEEFARDNGDEELKCTGCGTNYLSVCSSAASVDENTRRIAEGIEGVLNGSLPNFSMEYPCHSPTEERWFMMVVTPLENGLPGAVVAHNNITERKLAEKALKNARDELERRVEERTEELAKANVVLRKEIDVRKRAEKKLQKALDEIARLKDRLHEENIYLREEIKREHNFEEIVGNSEAIRSVLVKVEQVAPTDATVLILGETGTGKELVSRAVHHASSRKDRPLLKLNCATLPSNLIESELFGHERGAFTSAHAKQVGRFELADGGTIFLDEIGEMPLELQAKLLRVLQDGEFERLGSSRTIKVDVRVIAATNRDLKQEVRKGRFREDLWYRLNVFPVVVPPLRKRTEDIPLLVNFFADKFIRKMGKKIREISPKEVQSLQLYSWPGNVRELENVIERSVIVSQGPVLSIDVPKSTESTESEEASTESGGTLETAVQGPRSLENVERRHVLGTLESCRWKIEGEGGAAKALGIHPSTLRSRMKKLGIRRPSNP